MPERCFKDGHRQSEKTCSKGTLVNNSTATGPQDGHPMVWVERYCSVQKKRVFPKASSLFFAFPL